MSARLGSAGLIVYLPSSETSVGMCIRFRRLPCQTAAATLLLCIAVTVVLYCPASQLPDIVVFTIAVSGYRRVQRCSLLAACQPLSASCAGKPPIIGVLHLRSRQQSHVTGARTVIVIHRPVIGNVHHASAVFSGI